MADHLHINQRSLRLHEAVARKVDMCPELLEQARAWARRHDHAAVREWDELFSRDWKEVRDLMLSPDWEG